MDDPHDPITTKKSAEQWAKSFDKVEKAKAKTEEKKEVPVETNPGTSLTEPVVIDELTRRVREERKQEAMNRAQQGLEKELEHTVNVINAKDAHIAEAEGLLGELARRSNQEALTKQVDEDLKTAAGPAAAEKPAEDLKAWRKWFGPLAEIEEGSAPQEKKMFVPTPEQQKAVESIKAAAAAQEAANQKKAEKLGFWGTIKQVGSKFKDLPLLAAVKITEGLRSLVPKSRWGRATAVAAVGGILAAIYMRYNASPDMVDPGVVPPLEPAPTTPVTTEALPPIPTPEIFGGEAVVNAGDTVWGLVEERLAGNTTFAALDRAQQDFVLDSYMKHLQSLGESGVREFGIKSGDINVIHVGESLKMDKIADHSLFQGYVDQAEKLTIAQKANILKARQ